MSTLQAHTDSFAQGLRRYFSAEQIALLQGACIGIAGVGGLGSNCAMMLARCGIGHFVLVDYDVVEPSNLNRQHFFPHHVGQTKVDALAEQMICLNPHITIKTLHQKLDAENAIAIFAPCSIIVEAVDSASTKAILVQSLLSQGKSVVAASGMAGWGGAPMQKKRMGSRLVVVGDFINEVASAHEPEPEKEGLGYETSSEVQESHSNSASSAFLVPLSPRVTMAASMQADAVLEMVLGPCHGMR